MQSDFVMQQCFCDANALSAPGGQTEIQSLRARAGQGNPKQDAELEALKKRLDERQKSLDEFEKRLKKKKEKLEEAEAALQKVSPTRCVYSLPFELCLERYT